MIGQHSRQERLLLQVAQARNDETETGCWPWPEDARRNQKGYAQSGLGAAHRAVYEICIAPAPKGLHVAHRCRRRDCVRPAHLQLATAQQNTWDRPGCNLTPDLSHEELVAKRRNELNAQSRGRALSPEHLRKFESRVRRSGECRVWTGKIDEDGYGRFGWNGNVRGAHVVSYFIATGVWPDGLDVAHLCHNRCCVSSAHLKAMTRAEHMKHDARDGRHSRGHIGQRAHAVLKDQHIRYAKTRFAEDARVGDSTLADELRSRFFVDVSAAAVANVRKGRVGAHVLVEGFAPFKRSQSTGDDDIAALLALHTKGLRQREIAARLGRSQGWVSKMLKRHATG